MKKLHGSAEIVVMFTLVRKLLRFVLHAYTHRHISKSRLAWNKTLDYNKDYKIKKYSRYLNRTH